MRIDFPNYLRKLPPEVLDSFGVPLSSLKYINLVSFEVFFGPTFPVLTGSVAASLTAVADLAIAMIHEIQTEGIWSISPKQSATNQFNEHTQAMLHGTAWEDECNFMVRLQE
jgi:hypothetical protein